MPNQLDTIRSKIRIWFSLSGAESTFPSSIFSLYNSETSPFYDSPGLFILAKHPNRDRSAEEEGLSEQPPAAKRPAVQRPGRVREWASPYPHSQAYIYPLKRLRILRKLRSTLSPKGVRDKISLRKTRYPERRQVASGVH